MPEITLCVLLFEPSPVYAGRLGEGSEAGCGEEGCGGGALVLVGCFSTVLCVEDLCCEGAEGEGGQVAHNCCGDVLRYMYAGQW